MIRSAHNDELWVDAEFNIRPDTADDVVIDEIWVENVYQVIREAVDGRFVVDIGANIGALSILAARGGARTIHAYEPHPEHYRALRRNVLLNGLEDRITCFNEAVSDRAGPMWLNTLGDPNYLSLTSKLASGAAALTEEEQEGAILVQCVTMQTVLERVGRGHDIGMMKMDIEGGEFPVFAVLDDDALKDVAFFTMEFHGKTMSHVPTPAVGWEGAIENVVRVLMNHHQVHTMGSPDRGGQIYARRYGE